MSFVSKKEVLPVKNRLLGRQNYIEKKVLKTLQANLCESNIFISWLFSIYDHISPTAVHANEQRMALGVNYFQQGHILTLAKWFFADNFWRKLQNLLEISCSFWTLAWIETLKRAFRRDVSIISVFYIYCLLLAILSNQLLTSLKDCNPITLSLQGMNH